MNWFKIFLDRKVTQLVLWLLIICGKKLLLIVYLQCSYLSDAATTNFLMSTSLEKREIYLKVLKSFNTCWEPFLHCTNYIKSPKIRNYFSEKTSDNNYINMQLFNNKIILHAFTAKENYECVKNEFLKCNLQHKIVIVCSSLKSTS